VEGWALTDKTWKEEGAAYAGSVAQEAIYIWIPVDGRLFKISAIFIVEYLPISAEELKTKVLLLLIQ
jgi:hypothetical protein